MRWVLFLFCFAWCARAAEEPPREKFLAAFAPPDNGPVSISPDGLHLAYAQREKGGASVYIVKVAESKIVFRGTVGKEEGSQFVGNTRYVEPVRVTYLRWADNDRVVVATSYNHFIVINHREKYGQHLVDLNGEKQVFGPESGVLAGQVALVGRRTGRIIALTPGPPAFVFIEASVFAGQNRTSHVVLKINPATGAAEKVYDEEVAGRLAYDETGRARARYVMGFVRDSVFLRKPEPGQQKWQPLQTLFPGVAEPSSVTPEAFFGDRSFPLGFDRDTLFFASNVGRKTFGVYSLDLQSGQRTALTLEDPEVDLANLRGGIDTDVLVRQRVGQKVVGVRVPGFRSSTRWFDPELASLQSELEEKARGYSVQLVDWDDARERFVVEFHQRADPGAYYVYERAKQKLQHMLPLHAPQKALARVTSARWSLSQPDGSTLSGYLVLPAASASKPRPVVIYVPPYPWGPASNAYSSEITAFAQMGYAVLQVNYRGMAGYGKAHLQAGRYRAGDVTAEDIIAAIKALPPEANVDPKRVALWGEDYGGYLALRAVQRYPEAFTCVLTLEPVTDLVRWLVLKYPDSPYFKSEHDMHAWFFGEDKAVLRAASPITDPKSIRIPVLLVENPDSTRGNWGELGSFRRKLAAVGNPPTLVEVTPGIRVPGAEQARLWGRIEDFLNQHLGKP